MHGFTIADTNADANPHGNANSYSITDSNSVTNSHASTNRYANTQPYANALAVSDATTFCRSGHGHRDSRNFGPDGLRDRGGGVYRDQQRHTPGRD